MTGQGRLCRQSTTAAAKGSAFCPGIQTALKVEILIECIDADMCSD